MPENEITTMQAAGYESLQSIMAKRPYISQSGRHAGQPVVAMQANSGGVTEKPIAVNDSTRVLPQASWIRLDQDVQQAFDQRLAIVKALRDRGLTKDVGGLGTIVSAFQTAGRMDDADITMDGYTRAVRDRPEMGVGGTPIPVIQKPFQLSVRHMMAAANMGQELDTTYAAAAGRAVARTLEKMFLYGTDAIGSVSGYTVAGLTTFEGRATVSDLNDWTSDDTTGRNILDNVTELISTAEIEEHAYGPYVLFLSARVKPKLREDYNPDGATEKTILQKIRDLEEIDEVVFSDAQDKEDVILAQLTSDVVDVGVASDIQTIEASSMHGWHNDYQTFAAMAPRFKADGDSHCGVIHGTMED